MHHVFNTLFACVIVLGLFIYAQTFGGATEGRFAPVVEDVSITRVDAVGDTRSRIYGSFQKVRSCDFEGLRFFLGSPSAGARVDLVFEEPSKQRGAGYEDFGPWLVQLDAEQLAGRAYGVAYHRCHPFWLTETAFYP